MAGRLLPVALAVVSGVAIGVATFDGEFKAQRKQRLEEEYKDYSANASSLNSDGPSPMSSSAIDTPAPDQLPAKTEAAKDSKMSSLLGLWAWKSKDGSTSPASTTLEKNNEKSEPRRQ